MMARLVALIDPIRPRSGVEDARDRSRISAVPEITAVLIWSKPSDSLISFPTEQSQLRKWPSMARNSGGFALSGSGATLSSWLPWRRWPYLEIAGQRDQKDRRDIHVVCKTAVGDAFLDQGDRIAPDRS
jgi:hypothetical protein